MFVKLLVLFTLIPATELYLLVSIGSTIGLQRTIAIILITGILGAYLSRREGIKVFIQMQEKIQGGQVPGNELIDAFLILIAGALLLTPGFMTDITGFALLVRPVREFIRDSLKDRFSSSIRFNSAYQPHTGWDDRP